MAGDLDLLKVVDIESVTFSHRLKGYSIDEVDEFLDRAADTVQHYAEMHKADQQRIRQLEDEISGNDELKNSLKNAIDMARKTSDGFLASTQKESEAMLVQAKAKAETLIADAVNEKARLLGEIEDLRRARDKFIADARAALVYYSSALSSLEEKKN